MTAFLNTASPDRRVVEGLRLVTLFREATGVDPVMWGRTMVGFGSYKYVSPSPPHHRGEWPKVGFSPRKAKLTFYGLKDLPEASPLLPQLGKFTEGAGCIYANKLEDLDLEVLRKLIRIAWSRSDEPAGE
ncbi:DUF1801 domain-containing protein [Leucobacter sp. NPDC077196]|uniref:DUF1801 domain-containing protein n=1 Tax=Leucobacter sp. NPDC077196 TaxID=3154959 RepID=UPI003443130E